MAAVVLRDYQDAAIADVRVAFRDHQNVILVLSTGAGKTVIFAEITRLAKEKGKRVLILAHRDQLIKQCSRKLNDIGTHHGIIMAKVPPAPHERVQLGSIQTVIRRLHKIDWSPDIIIIDECHLSAANTYVTIRNHFPQAKLLGVTGSPCRLDNKPLGREFGGLYDVMVKGISISQLIERGFLVPPRVFAPKEQIDLSDIEMRGNDYNPAQLEAKLNKPGLIGNAVDHYQRICPDKPAVAWCVSVPHAQNVADAFNAAGIPARMLCGEHEGDYRDETLAMLASGELRVVTFVGLLVEGVDVPEIACVIMLRPTMSLSSYLQTIGRGLRPLPGKDCCFVLDHAGLTFRHGFADEERDWSLDWSERQKKKKTDNEPTIALEQCPECGAVFSPQAAELAGQRKKAELPEWPGDWCCPNCQADIERKVRVLDNQDGELGEITKEMAQRLKFARRNEVHKAQTIEQLLQIAAMRGYASSWAYHIYGSRQKKEKERASNMMASRVERMLATFEALGISQVVIEEYLQHPAVFTTADELDDLTQIWRALKAGAPVENYFSLRS